MSQQQRANEEDAAATETPVSEYVLLAASPRPLSAASSPQLQQQQQASPLDTGTTTAFALKSPFANKKVNDETDGVGTPEDDDDAHLLGRDFEREMVDVLIPDSPTHTTSSSSMLPKQNSQLDQIQEARGSCENGNCDDEEEGKEMARLSRQSKHDGGQEQTREGDGDGDDDEEEEEEAYRYVYLNSPEENAALEYCSNTVVTSRFTIYNFIPKLLFYEFSKLANAYFLMISVMQTVKPISNTGGFPASLPALTIIVLIDMFFACLEDYKRHKADHIANELPCLRYSLEKRAFEHSKWHNLRVGDIVKLYNREAVPADLVILAACEPEPENPAGICYVETKSLDGETNLKLRQGIEATYTTLLSDDQVADVTGVVICETPNNSIHRFNGSVSLKDGKKEAITTNAIVLRGSTLRNTEYIYGLVVNTGPDTKIMMASSNTPMKWSNMERRLNQQILYICALMIVLCLTGAIASSVWNHSNLSKTSGEKAWYLFDPHATAVKAPVGNFVIQILYYFLLLNSFIPVSLYVSMTSVKFMQAYFMNNDLEMYHEESDTPFQVRTMSLNEELGQIDYIFSDKTGTLTCNIMEFRKCSINGVAYGMGETEVGIAAKKRREAEQPCRDGPAIMEEREDEAKNDARHLHREVQAPFVNYQDDAIFDALAREGSTQAEMINLFFEHLGICHTVMPEKAPDGSLRLSASSPDEQALVAAAACFGYKFVARSPGKAMVEYFSCLADQDSSTSTQPVQGNQINAYQVLEVLEFNSTRKRMSVIAKMPDGKLKLLCKGADTVMYARLRQTTDQRVLQMRNKTLQDMEMFASEGLRTLVIAEADVDEKFFEGWVTRYRTAINDMRQIELRRLGEKNDIDRYMEDIEVNLEILGATAIEDRLQAEVPDTIHKLRQASIKIWMLTGDKEETAINIGFACRLLTPDVERVVITADTHPDLATIMEELERYSTVHANADGDDGYSSGSGDKNAGRNYRESTVTPTTESSDDRRPLTRIESIAQINSTQEELGLVIDGETLEVALEECPELLLSVAEKCVAVIACRVSPAQKAQLVRLVRDNTPGVRTLAIGDGANDVSMIQAAHVGVGISGQEGMQAANSSDYAIAQFRFLSRLLLVHGRWNYVRMGKLILYIFYKNVMMNLTQYWYMIFTGFSGQKFFLEWGLQGYNLFFTALPIVLVSTFEQDVPAHLAHNYPLLYRIGQENSNFNTKIVWAWISSCIWESLIISFGTLFGMRYLTANGDTPTMWVYGCTTFTIVLLVVTLKLCLHQQMWWPLHVVIYACSVSLWVVTAAIISNGNSISSAYWNGVFSNSFGVQIFWLLVPLLTFTALSRDILWKGYIRAFRPSYKHLAQEVNAFGMNNIADKLLAFPPPEKIPTEDLESRFDQPPQPPSAGRSTRASISEALKYAVATGGGGTTNMMPPRPIMTRQGLHRSVSRGSAFSYDAESVMVESFMATERYNSHTNPHEARTVFERHASRGSLAFHGLPDSEAVAHALNTTQRDGEHAPKGRERLHSAGNIFRGARHSFARRRFTSATMNANNGSGSGSSFMAANNIMTPGSGGRPPSVSDSPSPAGRAYLSRGSSGGEDALGTPQTPHSGEATPNQQRPPVHLVRRYTTPKFSRQTSV
ncbi:Phospholipid-transporting atpase drs2 [Globisporangium polare]